MHAKKKRAIDNRGGVGMKNFFRFGFVIFFAVAAVFATEIPPDENFYIKTNRAEINFSTASEGFFSARFFCETEKILKILVENENKNRYQYIDF